MYIIENVPHTSVLSAGLSSQHIKKPQTPELLKITLQTA